MIETWILFSLLFLYHSWFRRVIELSELKSTDASFINSLNRRFDFVDDTQFLNVMMNIANEQSRRQLNEIENPHQFIAAARHVTNCNCKINNHFMNFLPFKLKNSNNNDVKTERFFKQKYLNLPLEIWNIFEFSLAVLQALDCELQFVHFPKKKQQQQYIKIQTNYSFLYKYFKNKNNIKR